MYNPVATRLPPTPPASSSTRAQVTLAERWNGTGWSVQRTPNPSGALVSSLRGVSCTAPTACTAVGSYVSSVGAQVPLAERLNGTSWSVQATPNPSFAVVSSL